jgi:hypothetical protein
VKPIQGLTIADVTVIATHGDFNAKWETEEEWLVQVEKKHTFVTSVLGRELIAYLPIHPCAVGCSVVELTAAELFVAKRPLNTRALPMLMRQFWSGARRLDQTKVPEALKDNPAKFFEAWLNGFMDAGVEALHGEFDAEELFGEGKLLDTWRQLEEFLR